MNSLAFDGATDLLLANSPQPGPEAVMLMYRPKNYAEKARINSGLVVPVVLLVVFDVTTPLYSGSRCLQQQYW